MSYLKFRRSQVKKTALVVLSIAALALAGCNDKPKTEAPVAAPAPQQGQMPAAAPGGDPHAGMKAQEIPEAPPLANFQSKTLNKTFEQISFIPGVRIMK